MADAINIRVHSERLAEGSPTVGAARGRRVAAGDIVITRQNTIDIDTYTDHTLKIGADPVSNGQRWEVLAIDTDNGRARLRGTEAVSATAGMASASTSERQRSALASGSHFSRPVFMSITAFAAGPIG